MDIQLKRGLLDVCVLTAIKNEDSNAQIAKALDAEADKIKAAMPSDSYKIALCVEGMQYDSPALARLIGRMIDESGKIALIIGSSHGLSVKVKSACAVRLSFSRVAKNLNFSSKYDDTKAAFESSFSYFSRRSFRLLLSRIIFVRSLDKFPAVLVMSSGIFPSS